LEPPLDLLFAKAVTFVIAEEAANQTPSLEMVNAMMDDLEPTSTAMLSVAMEEIALASLPLHL